MAEQQEVMVHGSGFILGVPSASAFGTCRVLVDADNNVEVHPLHAMQASEQDVEVSVEQEEESTTSIVATLSETALSASTNVTQPTYYSNGG